eukprot:8922486-Alexandrium_andersonii.AAC.1
MAQVRMCMRTRQLARSTASTIRHTHAAQPANSLSPQVSRRTSSTTRQRDSPSEHGNGGITARLGAT